ncbi:autotransporter assembly complex protein TamA [Chitinibacter sp. SCUT-21]|uniref:autotransporter assembly complex protein TamA n=1 Tax=Chitinibacter sp. SCUT-21 TaxID=2970891 RepID=UPI0035A60089
MRLLPLICAALFTVPAWAEDETFKYEVKLEANEPANDLLKRYLNIYKLQRKNRFTAELLQREVDAVPAAAQELLATEGYFDAKVDVQYREEGNTHRVYIKVDQGEQTLVTDTSVVLQGAVLDNADRYQELDRRFNRRGERLEQQAFRQSVWDDFKKRSLQLVQARQYPAAKLVSSEAVIHPERKAAEFDLLIDSGPAYVFGPYTIHGLSRYPEKLIANRIKITQGQDYSREALSDLQSEIQAMPQFGTALVDVELTSEPPFVAPIRIDVQEVPLHRVSGSVGFSTNTRFKSELAYRYHNLFDQGWVFDSSLRIEQLEQAAELAVLLPKNNSDWEHRVWGSYLAQDLQGLDSHLYKMGVSRGKKGDEIERVIDLQYQIENRQFADGSEEHPQSLTLNHIWTQRKLDNRNNPRNGYLVQAEMGGALKQLISDATFLRLFTRGAYYYRVGSDGQIVVQGSVGQTFSQSPQGITSDWLFRAGGSGSVRGYDYESLGVKSNGSTVGGQVIGTASFEYQHPVIKDWKAAMFVDYGGAGEKWSNMEKVMGVGVGARWKSPVGQIGADIAYGVDYEQYRFHFAMGLVF